MKPIKKLNTLLIPCFILVLLLGQSCMNIQKMRYTRGLHIDIKTFDKMDNKTLAFRHAKTAKKKTCLTKSSYWDTNSLIGVNNFQKSNNINTNKNLDTITKLNLLTQISSSVISSNFNNDNKNLINSETAKIKPTSLQEKAHKTDEIITTQGSLSRGQIMLLALLNNMLAAIAILLLTSVATSTTILGVLCAGLCAVAGLLVAKYGFDEAQYDTGWFLLLYYFACFPGFVVNACIAIAFAFVISFS